MFFPQFVQCESAVEAGILAQLSWDDLKGASVRGYQELILACDGQSMLSKEPAQLHLNCSAPRHDSIILDGSPHNHDGIMQGALCLLNELLRSPSQYHGAGLSTWTAGEEVVPEGGGGEWMVANANTRVQWVGVESVLRGCITPSHSQGKKPRMVKVQM